MSDRREESFLGRGWSFPPSFSRNGAGVEMESGASDVHQSLMILLSTVPGERVMQETFGCDLTSLVFEELDQGLVNTVQRLVKQAIIEFEPRVDIEGVDVTRSDTEAATMMISVKYTVRGTNSRYNMVFPFYLMEATPPGV